MPEDLGQDFLNGYFAMNAKRQNQQNFQQELQMRKDQFAQTMQLNQQKSNSCTTALQSSPHR